MEMANKVPDSVSKVYQAARDGTADLKDLLKRLNTDERKTALETKTKDGDQITTPLIIAARNGKLDSVKMLLTYKADIEARGTVKVDKDIMEGCTPLWAAAATGHLDVVKLLIERNADVDGRTSTNSTPLRTVAYDGRLDIVRCLIMHGADVNARNNFDSTPLLVACFNGHMNVANYLIEQGANIHLQDKNGDTVLHYGAERGDVQVVRKLLAFGVKVKQNYKRLTPLLAASNSCKIEMVEYFIKRPECTKEERIEGLELLGATIANKQKVYDIEKAFSYMKRGMEERYEDPSHPFLKKEMEPLLAYQNRKESQTLEELALLEGDDHAIHMEGLIIRERILGTDNTELRNPVIFRGAVLADSEQYELCIGLLTRSMEIALSCDDPFSNDLHNVTNLFGGMVHKGRVLRRRCIEDVFEKLVAASERLTEKSKSGKLKEEHKREKQEETLYYALYLLMVFTKIKGNRENADMIDLIRRFLRASANPCTRDGNTLLHLVAWYKTPILDFKGQRPRIVCQLPCVETMKLIINAGGYVNAVNNEGNTPLHLAVTYKPSNGGLQELRDVLETLLDGGAHEDLVNNDRKSAMDIAETEEARRILSAKSRLELKCIAARAVRKFGLSYCGLVPKTVEKFISLH